MCACSNIYAVAGIDKLIMASYNIKAPPTLSKSLYELWRKELQISHLCTNVEKNKQGPALFLTLEGKALEAALELHITKISGKNGIKNITEKLDTLYKKDRIYLQLIVSKIDMSSLQLVS